MNSWISVRSLIRSSPLWRCARMLGLLFWAALGGGAAEWKPYYVPGPGDESDGPRTYRCFLRVPDNMTSRAAVDLWSDSAMLSVADFPGPFSITLNGQPLASGNSLPQEPRRRYKIPKGILERGQYNVLAIHLEAASAGIRTSPVLAGYHDELVLAGQWEVSSGGTSPEDFRPRTERPALAVFVETQFRESSTPLARNAELVPGARLTPAETLRRLRPGPGWTVELMLSEPEIAQPTHFSFDARGRLWMAQYRQYPYPAGIKMLSRDKYYRATFDRLPPPPPNHVPGADIISVHEDTDGDGRWDRHKNILTNLNMANAVVHGHGGIWVMNTPYLLFYPDVDEDDVPDGPPEVRLAGFGLEDTHSVANGLVWGTDGWLYGAQGSTTTSRVTRPGIDPSGAPGVYYESCMVWRYHPENRAYEIFAEGGGNNFGLEVDGGGRIYTGHNGGQTRGWHFIPNGIFLKQGKEPGKFGPPSNPYAFGELPMMSSTNSITRFSHHFAIAEGSALPIGVAGYLFSVDPLHRQVVISQPVRRGSTFATSDIGLGLESEDPSVRPVFIANSPDGSLYVADFYEEYIAHGQNYQGQIDPTSGRIYRLRGTGLPLASDVNLAGKSTAELIATLSHPNRWQRQTAVRLIGERHDLAAPAKLRELVRPPVSTATSASPKRNPSDQVLTFAGDHPALEAFWALAQGGWLVESDLEAAWRHPSPRIRAWAIRLAGDRKVLTPSFLAAVTADVAQEPDAEVRCHVAAVAGRLPAPQALVLLQALWERDIDTEDPYIPLAGWHALERVSALAPEAILRASESPLFWQSRLAREHWHGRLMRRWVGESTQVSLKACGTLLHRAPDAAAKRALVQGFEAALADRGRTELLPPELLSELKAAGANSLPLRLRLLEPDAIPEAIRRLAEVSAPLEERLRVARVLGEIRAKDSVMALSERMRVDAAIEMRRAALSALAEFDESGVGREIAAAYALLPAAVRSSAQGVLSSRPKWNGVLMDLLEQGSIGLGELTPEALTRMRASTDPEIRKRIQRLVPTVTTKAESNDAIRDTLERVRKELSQGAGSPYAGEPIFVERCAGCHQLFHKGGLLGPNLTAYQREDLGTLLPSILAPSAEIREGFRGYVLTAMDGRILSGLVTDQTVDRVFIRGLDGETVAIDRRGIQELTAMEASLMPEGLLEGLSGQQLRDFFAYLRIPQPISR